LNLCFQLGDGVCIHEAYVNAIARRSLAKTDVFPGVFVTGTGLTVSLLGKHLTFEIMFFGHVCGFYRVVASEKQARTKTVIVPICT
jgi:hypothetical protein